MLSKQQLKLYGSAGVISLVSGTILQMAVGKTRLQYKTELVFFLIGVVTLFLMKQSKLV